MGAAAMKTQRLTAASAVVEFLKRQFVRRDGVEERFVPAIAGIFGHGNVAGLGLAIAERGGVDLPFLQPKNEQGMVHMATAFAKAKRRLATLACTTSIGPGATNLVTGAATATVNRLPVLLLPGDVFASRLPDPVLQQLEHPLYGETSVNDCLRPVSRYWDRITRPEQLLRALPEAMRVLVSPSETGAVTLAFPQDVQAEAFDYPAELFEKRVYDVPRPSCSDDALRAAAEILRRAKRPLLVAGGGVYYSDASRELRTFAERTGIPVAVTQAGKGVLLDDHPKHLGAIGVTGTEAANEVARGADVVLFVGARLGDFTTASRTLFAETARFLAIQIDARDAQKHGAFPLVGDARVILEALGKALPGHHVSNESVQITARARAAWDAVRRTILHPPKGHLDALTQVDVIRILNAELGTHATIVHAAGGLPGDLHKLWRCTDEDQYHAEYGYSCMGYEIAGAVGVKLARPDRDVYALVGDGSYLMMHGELVTSLQEGLRITIVLVDNGGYRCIRSLQQSTGGTPFGNDFRRRIPGSAAPAGELLAIDYAANARSLGAHAYRATTERELVEAIAAARGETRTTLIHVPVVDGPDVPSYAFWDVPISEVSDTPETAAARERSEKAKARQRRST